MDHSAQALDYKMVGQPTERSISKTSKKLFLSWTLFWWSLSGVCSFLFYFGVLDFVLSAKISLYGVSIWLNGWLFALVARKKENRSKMSFYHDCVVIWMFSYAFTNAVWEIPWLIFSPFIFNNINSIADVLSYTDYMRESLLHMYWWALASFSSVDLRTVNHDPTFYTLELYSFVNVFSTIYFFHLNKKRSPYRYLVPVLGCGAPAVATFIFSFVEVFSGFVNMVGGVADILLALVWTQYQYLIFPMIIGYFGYRLLMDDWQQCYLKGEKTVSSNG